MRATRARPVSVAIVIALGLSTSGGVAEARDRVPLVARTLIEHERAELAGWRTTLIPDECRERGIPFEPRSVRWRIQQSSDPATLGSFFRPDTATRSGSRTVDVVLGPARYIPEGETRRIRGGGPGYRDAHGGLIPGGYSVAFRYRGCPYVLEEFEATESALRRFARKLEPKHHFLDPEMSDGSVFVIYPKSLVDFLISRKVEVGVRGELFLTTALRELFDRFRPRYYWSRSPLTGPRIPLRSVSVSDGIASIDFYLRGFRSSGTTGSAWWAAALTDTVFQFPHIEAIRFTSDGECWKFFGYSMHDAGCPEDELVHRRDPSAA